MPIDTGSADDRVKRATRLRPYLTAAAAGVVGLFIERFGSAHTLRSYQTARLRALLRHSYETVPFYRRRFEEAGFHPDQFRTIDDLQRVPITRKDDLRLAAAEDVIARDYDPARLVRYGTGGSTGTPTEVRFTAFEDGLLRIMRIQANLHYGLRPWHRRITSAVRPSKVTGLLEKIGLFPSVCIVSSTPWEEVRGMVREFRPDVIRGYPAVLASLADGLSDEDRRYVRPSFITTDSETLTEGERMRIEAGFGVRLFDIYDCFECNVIAYQCPQSDSYHVMDVSLVVEVLNNNRAAEPGESGEIAFTSLHAWAAPLIRYMPGDIVEKGSVRCSCGAPNSCLAKIHGRSHDRFFMPDGRVIHPKLLSAWIYPLCSVLRLYKIEQETRDRVVVTLQPALGVEPPPEKVEVMRNGIENHLGKGVTVLVKVVDQIPFESNGKFRPFRCYLDERESPADFL